MVRLLYFQNVHLLSLALMNAWERLVAFLEFRLSARVGPKSKCVMQLAAPSVCDLVSLLSSRVLDPAHFPRGSPSLPSVLQRI
mgnify:CR=1 FL=1